MNYIYNYSLASIFFMSLTMMAYFTRRRMNNRENRIFTAMLICSMVALVFDCAAAAAEPHGMAWPAWCLYAFNGLFILGVQTCLPAFSLYTLEATELYRGMRRRMYLPIVLPYALVLTGLLLSPFSKAGIFYIDEQHIYRHGAMYSLLYINTALYITLGVAAIFRYGKKIDKRKKLIILYFALLLAVAVIVQLEYPLYLLTTSATALAITSIFYILQSPEDHIDPITGVFNRPVLSHLINDTLDRDGRYTLLLFYLPTFDMLSRIFGLRAADALLSELAAYLTAAFPKRPVVRMETAQFVVMYTDAAMDMDKLIAIRRAVPESFLADGVAVHAPLRMAVIESEAHATAKNALAAMDYVFQNCATEDDGVFVADAAFREKFDERIRLETSVEALLMQDRTELVLRPVRRADGSLAMLDAALHPCGAEYCNVTPEAMLQATERAGCMRLYNQCLLAKLAAYCASNGMAVQNVECFAIPLSPVECMKEDAVEALAQACAAAGFEPESISLCFSETPEVLLLSNVKRNLQKIQECGFTVQLDAFAAGYADFDILFDMNFRYVRIDESMLGEVMESSRQTTLLSGILDVIGSLGLQAVCPAAKSPAEREILHSLGIELFGEEPITIVNTAVC